MSVYNLNGISLQSVYGINGNILQQAYDIIGNELLGGSFVFADSTTLTDIYTSSINAYPQGGCMDDEGNLCTCLLTTSEFIKHNIASGVDVRYSFTPDSYGHANGMTYNPNTQRFYVAPSLVTGEVFVFNKSFELVDTLYARDENGNLLNCWNIAYNRYTDRLVSAFGIWVGDVLYGKLITYDSDLNYLHHTSFDMVGWVNTRQDIETDGYYIYAVSYNPNDLYVFDFQGNIVKKISNANFPGEPENLCYDWSSNFYMSGKSNYFIIKKVEFIE